MASRIDSLSQTVEESDNVTIARRDLRLLLDVAQASDSLLLHARSTEDGYIARHEDVASLGSLLGILCQPF